MTEARLIRPGRHGAIFGFAGWSGSGKTTLVEKIISHISASGVDVATIKHAHHHFNADLAKALRNDGEDGLRDAIIEAIGRKPKGHDFVISRRAPNAAVARHMNVTGG